MEQQDKEKQLQMMVSEVKQDGDVTDDLFSECDSASKKKLCQQLNKDAVKEREAALDEECAKAPAEIIRSRVKVVASVEEVKDHMERNSKDGIKGPMPLA